MHLTWANLWTVTLAANATVWIFLPATRPAVSLILLIHVPVLVWGIADIRSQFFGQVLWRNDGRRDALALTFDDGPDPAITPDILQLLDKHGCKATFFVVASRARENPDLVRRAYLAGHTIACHDLDHAATANLRLGPAMLRQIGEAQRTIGRIIGRPPALYRPPVGLMNPHVIPALRRLGMTCVGWSRRSADGGNRRAGRIREIPTLAGPGEVVLLHDILPRPDLKPLIMQSVERLIERIAAGKLRPLTVDEFFGLPPYSAAEVVSAAADSAA